VEKSEVLVTIPTGADGTADLAALLSVDAKTVLAAKTCAADFNTLLQTIQPHLNPVPVKQPDVELPKVARNFFGIKY